MQIRREYPDLTDPTAPLREPLFKELVRELPRTGPLLRSALADPGLSDDLKLLAVMALQGLPDDAYIKVAAGLVDALEMKQLSVDVARAALFPDERWSVALQRRYTDRAVRGLFEKYKGLDTEREELSEFLLSGGMWRSTEEMLKSGAIVPVR